MRKRYLIEKVNTKDHLYLPREFRQHSDISKLSFGSFETNVHVVIRQTDENIIRISTNVYDALKIPQFEVPLHAFLTDDTIHLGPLVGIFTAGFTSFPVRPIGDRSLFFSKLLATKKLVGALPFVFGEQHIDWETGTITGYFFDNHQWTTTTVPFPNVVYDRLPNRKTENLPALRIVKERLQKEYLIPWYNPGFFNKLHVHDALSQNEKIKHYLPETKPFTSITTLKTMLEKYRHVYVKPINGSLGYGVYQIMYNEKENNYFCRFRDRDGKNRLIKFRSFPTLVSEFFKENQLKHFIIQQGILLLNHEHRPVDFRIHTNKDENGTWQITAMAAKVAGPGSATTHLKSGGEVKTIEEIFSPEERKEAIQKLTDAAMALSEAIENELEGIIAEIGFDIGIDQHGNVWIFEANSKPGRSIFLHPQLKNFDVLSRKLSLAFSVYLTEKTIVTPDEIYL